MRESGNGPPRRTRHLHFDLVAPWYDRLFGRGTPEAMVDYIAPAPGMIAVDVGGGTGRFARRLASTGVTVLVVDPSPAMLAVARERRLHAVRALAESLPLPDGCADRVLALDALHHFANQHWATGEMLRILKPGGLLLLQEPDLERPGARLLAMAEKLLGMQSRFLAPDAILALAPLAGSELVAEVEEGWNVLLVLRKADAPETGPAGPAPRPRTPPRRRAGARSGSS